MADRLPGQPGYLLSGGAPPAGSDEDPSTRSWPRAIGDFALNVGAIVPETYRAVTGIGHSIEDKPSGWWQRRDKEASDLVDWYKGLSSPKEHQVAERKFWPGVDDQSAWDAPFSVAAHHVASLVPFLFSGPAAKLVTSTPAAAAKVAKTFNIGGMGLQQFGAYNSALRDYFEKTPLVELNEKVPGFSDLVIDLGEASARNEAYKKAFSPVAAVLNAGVGALGGAGVSHAVGGMQKALLPRTAIGVGEGVGMGFGMGAAGEYGRQQGLVNVGAQGAIDTEKVLRAGGESAVPMAAIVGTTHAVMGKYAGKKAETPPPNGGPPADIRAALAEEWPQPGGFGSSGEGPQGPVVRQPVGPTREGPPMGIPDPSGPGGPAGRPAVGEPTGRPVSGDFGGETTGRPRPFAPEAPLPAEAPGVGPRPFRPTPYGGEAPLPGEAPGRPARPVDRAGRMQPEAPDPYLPTEPQYPIRDQYPAPRGFGTDVSGDSGTFNRPGRGTVEGPVRPPRIGPGPTTQIGFPPPSPPGSELVRGPGPPRTDLPGTPPAEPFQPPRLTYQGLAPATYPSGAPSIMTPGARTLAEYEQTLRQPPKRPPGGGGGGGGGGPAPPAVARERARRAQPAAPAGQPAAPTVERGTSRTLQPGDTIVDTDGTRIQVVETRPEGVTVRAPTGEGTLTHADMPGQLTIERAAPAAAPKKEAPKKEAPKTAGGKDVTADINRAISGEKDVDVGEMPEHLRRHPKTEAAKETAQRREAAKEEPKAEPKEETKAEPKEEPKKEVTEPVKEEALPKEEDIDDDWVPPNKPEYFDQPAAKELRRLIRRQPGMRGFPDTWEELVKVARGTDMRDILLAHIDVLQEGGRAHVTEAGKVYIGKAADKVVRRLKKGADREVVAEQALKEGREGEDVMALVEEAGSVLTPAERREARGIKASEEADERQPENLLSPEERRERLKAEATRRPSAKSLALNRPRERPDVVAIARRVLAVMDKQLARYQHWMTEALNTYDRKEPYVHGVSEADETLRMPTKRAGGKQHPAWSAIVQVNARRNMIHNTLERFQRGTGSERIAALRTLRRQLDYWANDELQPVEEQAATRRLASLVISENRAEAKAATDEEGNVIVKEKAAGTEDDAQNAQKALDDYGAYAAIEKEAGRTPKTEQELKEQLQVDPQEVQESITSEPVGFYGQRLTGQGATLQRSTEAQLIRRQLAEYDEYSKSMIARGLPVETEQQLRDRLRVHAERENIDPDLADEIDKTLKRTGLVPADPQTGEAPKPQKVRQSLLDAEEEGNRARGETGRHRTGYGALGEAMIRAGVMSEAGAIRLIRDPTLGTLEWAKEVNRTLAPDFANVLSGIASDLRKAASDIRRTTGTGFGDPTSGPGRRLSAEELARRRAGEEPEIRPSEETRPSGGVSGEATRLETVAKILTDFVPDVGSYPGRTHALERVLNAYPEIRPHLSEGMERDFVDWIMRNNRVDDTLEAVHRLTPRELDVLPAARPEPGRGEPVLTPVTAGVGLAPNDVRARVEQGLKTTVKVEPSKEDLFVPLPRPDQPLDHPDNLAALRARTGIYARNPRSLGEHVVKPLRDVAMPTPPKETVARPKPEDDVVKRVVDYLFKVKKPDRYPHEVTDDEFVQSSPTRDLTHQMYDRTDPIDVELRKVADQTVGHVPITVLHPDIYNALMTRLKAPLNTPGYYDWRTDTIYMNRTAAEATTRGGAEAWNQYLRHEVGHAMTFGAIETSPRAQAAIKALTDIIGTKEKSAYWGRELKGTGLEVADVTDRLSKPHEFIQELQANKDFRRVMAAVPLTGAERARLRTPNARTVFEAAKEWIYRAVKSLFGRSDNALTDGLAMTFEILEDTMAVGRRAYDTRPGYRRLAKGAAGETGAPGFWNSALGEKLGSTGAAKQMKYLVNKRGGTWGQKAFWTHTLEDLTRWGNDAFKGKTVPILETVAELNTMAHNYARERGDETLLKAVGEMQKDPNADRVADYLLRVSKHQAHPDTPLYEGKNAHVRKGSILARQQERIHDRMQAEHQALLRDVPYYKDVYKMAIEWGEKVARDDALVVANDTVGMDAIVHERDGSVNELAKSALTKWVVNRKDVPLTAAEQGWIDRQRPDPRNFNTEDARMRAFLDRMKFDKLVAGYRDNPDFARTSGPWIPFKRFGDHAISGDYNFPEPVGGRHIDRGMFEFDNDPAAENFIDRVTDTSGVKLLDSDRVVYVRDPTKPREQWSEAQKEDVTTWKWEGGQVNEPGYVVTTSEGTRRVSPKEAENDPAFEVRRRVNFNDKHVEFFRKEREAAERLEELRSNPHVRMRSEVELVTDYGGSQSPHYMSKAMGELIKSATNSWEYKRMTEAERRAWKQRLMTSAAKQVMMAGGRAPGLMREYVEGASKDLLETYAMASAQSSFNHAHYTHGQSLRDKFKALDEQVRTDMSPGGSDRKGVSEELQRRAYAVNDPFVHGAWGTATNRLLQFTYTAKLAGTSFLGLNMMEPSLLWLPMLAGQVGPWQALKLLKGAYSDVGGLNVLGRGVADFKKAALNRDGDWNDYQETLATNLRKSKAPDAENEIKMFDVMAQRGYFDRTAANEVTMLRAPNPTIGGKVLDRIDNSFRGINTSVEAMNRAVIALSAFRAAKGTFEERTRAAQAAVFKGAGVYAAWNAPPAFNHPVARLALQFKKYPQRVISNYIGAAFAAAKGDRVALKQLGWMLGTTAMAAGMFGLPTEIFSIPFNALNILGLAPSWDEITAGAYGIMADQLGPEAAEVIAHGAPRMFNVDLSGRAGQNNLLFFDRPQSNKPQDLKASLAGVILGAGGSTMFNGIEGIGLTAKALSEAVSGSSQRASDLAMQAARDFMPIKAGVDIIDAIRKAGGDLTPRTKGGAALGPELTAGETAMRVLGVQSGREARYWEGRRVEQRTEKASQENRATWLDRMATATPGERPGIQRSIREWNDTHPRADYIGPGDIAKAVSRRRTEETRPRSDLAMPKNRRYETQRQDTIRTYNLQGL